MATADPYVPNVEIPNLELPTEDGEPLESSWHRAEINLLIDSLVHHWRDRTDFYAGGNMFIYYSLEQVRTRDYRGPDFFVVLDVDGRAPRDAWVVWQEGGRYPNVIVELLSPSTATADKTTKKKLYEQTFRTPDYFCYDPQTKELVGWRLVGSHYVELEPNPEGRLWSEELQLWLGLWEGTYLGQHGSWLRFFAPEGALVLTQAEAERQRAEQAEAELARLQERLRAAGIDPEQLA